ncbi:MAG TPA: YdcF family protein [Alphaproteobacteria bacterium]|nr:YdcF family protein [Alphaproteobacteria bacterium]MDP6270772.1 YdcF family protein [Alphaproteobacteria bacterium]MDP7428344.1 YdcF family protein [Alphaproteobacteria bacterium]HJM50332.1 YdcF family protein [Alphaproteobacteria bacterium]
MPSQVEDPHEPSDGIVVLTGGTVRLAAGFALLDAGKAKQLFISGVHRGTSREHIKRLMAEAPARFECCVELGKVAENTAGNATETAAWVARGAIRTLRLVTAGYHMPRSLLEFRQVMPEVRLIAHPVFPKHVKLETWWRWPGTALLLATEFSKYLFSLVKARLGGLSGSLAPA